MPVMKEFFQFMSELTDFIDTYSVRDTSMRRKPLHVPFAPLYFPYRDCHRLFFVHRISILLESMSHAYFQI